MYLLSHYNKVKNSFISSNIKGGARCSIQIHTTTNKRKQVIKHEHAVCVSLSALLQSSLPQRKLSEQIPLVSLVLSNLTENKTKVLIKLVPAEGVVQMNSSTAASLRREKKANQASGSRVFSPR